MSRAGRFIMKRNPVMLFALALLVLLLISGVALAAGS